MTGDRVEVLREAPRGNCPICGKDVALRNDGTVRHHFSAVTASPLWCEGGYPPEPDLAAVFWLGEEPGT